MSDTATAATPVGGTRRRIRAQPSPHDPRSMRFLLDEALPPGRAATFTAPDPEAPLADALLRIDGIAALHAEGPVLTLTRTDAVDWETLKAPVAAAIRDVLDRSAAPLGRAGDAPDADAALLAAVRDLLDRQANPAIAAHGGHITAEDVRDGVVFLRMSGGCQGCAASAATLRDGIETMLRAARPDIRGIRDVTDHGAGTAPYYPGAPGRSPALRRPVPAGAIGWEDGQLVIAPEYLAPRLGLDPESLRAGLRDGSVVGLSEAGTGADDGKTRVTVRSAQRAWAAELLPDGSAFEVPPPRRQPEPDALTDRVRRHLSGRAPDAPPLTYGQLARALRMFAPGSVRRVTAALEATMREDAAAGRPFIAAAVAARGSDLPARGFFDTARALDRGPAEEEDAAAFVARERDALRAMAPAPHAAP